MQIKEGPYGGGMNFCRSLKKWLQSQNIEVIHHLDTPDIDLVLILNTTFTSTYSIYAAAKYQLNHPQTTILLRINDSGLQRASQLLTRMMIECARYADDVIYISEWLKTHMEKKCLISKPSHVIYNGADTTLYNNHNHHLWDTFSPLKIITHHWSPNYRKGHAIYTALDQLLADPANRKKFTFTYIGQHPQNVNFHHSRLLAPMPESEVAQELKAHHVYITGALDEAAGMHHIEAALCGLPILYVASGGVPEYCRNFGIEITQETLQEKLEEIRLNYAFYAEKIKSYPHTSLEMVKTYLNIFRTAVEKKKNADHQNDPRGIRKIMLTFRLACQDAMFYPMISLREKLDKILLRQQKI